MSFEQHSVTSIIICLLEINMQPLGVLLYHLFWELIENISNSLRLLSSHSSTSYCLGYIALHSLRESPAFSFRWVKNKMPDNNSSECFQIIRVVTVALGFLSRLVYFPL